MLVRIRPTRNFVSSWLNTNIWKSFHIIVITGILSFILPPVTQIIYEICFCQSISWSYYWWFHEYCTAIHMTIHAKYKQIYIFVLHNKTGPRSIENWFNCLTLPYNIGSPYYPPAIAVRDIVIAAVRLSLCPSVCLTFLFTR